MAYGPNYADGWRRAAKYVHKILNGAKPSELTVEQPTKFELVVNLKTAKALGRSVERRALIWPGERRSTGCDRSPALGSGAPA